MSYSVYPGGIDDFQNVVDNQDYVQAVHVNRLNEAVNKIEAELGTYPSGTYNDVKTRLDNTKIGDLSDVIISNPAQNNVITYASGSSTWENRELNLDDIPNGSTSKLGQDCSSTGSPAFSNVTTGTVVLEGGTYDTTLQAGTPAESVTYTLPADDGSSGQVLATDGSGNLSWATAAPGSESLNDLTDVTITTPSDNQILRYDSGTTQWLNESLTADDIPDGATNVIITSTQETDFGTAYTHSQLTTGNPHDVTAAQAGAIADTADSVKDSHIDWGTGANQVSLDDVPDGSTSKLGQDCSTTGSPAFSSVNGLTLTENTTGFAVAGGTSTEKTLTVSETATIDQDLQQTASPTFAGATIGGALDLNGNLDMSTGVYDLVVKGNESVALEIKDDTETYLTIDSTDSNEKVKIQKTLEIGGSYTLPNSDGSASQVLTTNGSGVASWQNPASTVTQLNDLSDVTITTPSDNQILRYDSGTTQWLNESLTADDIPDGATNVIITSTQETDFGTAYTHSQLTTGNPHDVTAAQAGAIADTADSVKDSHIDWGTGANQVSLDDVPDGSTSKLGQDCSTTGSPTFSSVNGIDLTENTTGFAVAGGTSTEKTLTVSETATIDQDLQQTASPLFSNLNLAGNVTLSNGSDRTVAVSQASSGNGNSLTVKAGDAYATGDTEGGKLILQAGAGGDGEDAEDGEIILKSETFFDSVNLTGTAVLGRGIAGTDTAGQDLLILGGEPDEGSALDLDGGDIYITGGPSVNSGSDGNVILGYNPEESAAQGKVNFHNAYEFPTTDGSDGQVLTTDGSGNVSWEDGGGSSSSTYAKQIYPFCFTFELNTAIPFINPFIMDSDGNFYILGMMGSTKTLLSKSTDKGKTWAELGDLGATESPAVAIDGNGDFHAVWEKPDGSYFRIFYSKFSSNSWSTPVAISSSGSHKLRPDIVVYDTDKLWVTYVSYANSIYNIYAIQYTTSWQTEEQVTNNSSYSSTYPLVIVDSSNNPHIVFRGADINYSDSALSHAVKSGGSWSLDGTSYTIYFPTSLAIDSSDKIYIGTRANQSSGSWYSRTSGGTWAQETGSVEGISIDSDGDLITLQASGNSGAVFQAAVYRRDGSSSEEKIFNAYCVGDYAARPLCTFLPKFNTYSGTNAYALIHDNMGQLYIVEV